MARLAGKGISGIPPLTVTTTGPCPHPITFRGCWPSELRLSFLHAKHFINRTISLAPATVFKFASRHPASCFQPAFYSSDRSMQGLLSASRVLLKSLKTIQRIRSMSSGSLSSILILGVLIQGMGLMAPHTGLLGAPPARQVSSPDCQCVERVCPSMGTLMKISKLLSTDGCNAGLWDLSCSLRKSRVSTEVTPGGLMKVGRDQVFVKGLQSESGLIHFVYAKTNSIRSWNV